MANALTYEIVQDRISAAQAGLASARARIEIENKRIEELNGEIGDLLAAARVLARLDGIMSVEGIEPREPQMPSDFDPNEQTGNPYRRSTNKAFMWSALKLASQAWLTANEIQEFASKLKGGEIPMSSVSPGLSEMKQDGTIERDGMKVALKSRLNENGEAKASPDAGGVAAPSSETFDL